MGPQAEEMGAVGDTNRRRSLNALLLRRRGLPFQPTGQARQRPRYGQGQDRHHGSRSAHAAGRGGRHLQGRAPHGGKRAPVPHYPLPPTTDVPPRRGHEGHQRQGQGHLQRREDELLPHHPPGRHQHEQGPRGHPGPSDREGPHHRRGGGGRPREDTQQLDPAVRRHSLHLRPRPRGPHAAPALRLPLHERARPRRQRGTRQLRPPGRVPGRVQRPHGGIHHLHQGRMERMHQVLQTDGVLQARNA